MEQITTLFRFCILVALLNAASSQTGIFVPQLERFDSAMQQLLKKYDIPGGQLAITYHGRLVYNRGFGLANKEDNTLVQPNHIFRIASVSKPITAVAILKLVEQGILHLSDTVFGADGILNDAIYQNILDDRVRSITVRNLLNHSGGWNSNVSGDPMFNAFNIAKAMGTVAPADSKTVIQYTLANKKLDFAPGSQYAYSNFGFCILGRVIEKITGQTYEEYVRKVILLPINITNMHRGFNLKANQLPMEVNYYDHPNAAYANSVYDNITSVPWPYAGFNIEAMDAHGGWVTSAEGLCKLLVSVDKFPTKPDILLPETIDTMVKASAMNPDYALGWAVNSADNWWHTGSLPGTTSQIVRGHNQLNWAILLNSRPANSDIKKAVDALVWNVLPHIESWPHNDLFFGTAEHSDDD